MKNLNQLLTKPLKLTHKKSFIAIFVLALLGFADATYLTVEHYTNKIPPCSIGSCETVLTSEYANILGVPVSLMGTIFYLIILISLILFWDLKKPIFARLPMWFSFLGAVISILLVALMVFVIHSICIYCVFSDVITVIISIIFLVILKKEKVNEISA